MDFSDPEVIEEFTRKIVSGQLLLEKSIKPPSEMVEDMLMSKHDFPTPITDAARTPGKTQDKDDIVWHCLFGLFEMVEDEIKNMYKGYKEFMDGISDYHTLFFSNGTNSDGRFFLSSSFGKEATAHLEDFADRLNQISLNAGGSTDSAKSHRIKTEAMYVYRKMAIESINKFILPYFYSLFESGLVSPQ